MKAGKPLLVRLPYPVYVNGKLAVPANTLVDGKVTALKPDEAARMRARAQAQRRKVTLR